MKELFNRDFAMTVGNQEIGIQKVSPVTKGIEHALRVRFTIEKSASSDPNRVDVEIFNLAESNRRVLQVGSDLAVTSAKQRRPYDWPLVINAGYVGSKAQIFSGDISFADSRQENTEWLTQIQSEDGGKQYRSAVISKSFSTATSVATVLTALADALDIGLGNAAAHFAAGAEQGYLNFDHGVVLVGRVSKLLDKYITSAGYKWSIQDGQLQVLGPDEFLLDDTVVLNSATGLVGSPERGENGVVTVISLMQPSIKPGRLVVIESKMINGRYKATTVRHIGDTWGPEWYTQFEGKPL